MTNPRDTGRYDATTDTWVDTNVRIDFAWGNLPIQPNDDRGVATLDPALDNHEIVTEGLNGYPSFGEPAGPAAIFGPTDNWTVVMGGLYFAGETTVNEDLAANEAAYKLVITGGNYAGEYTIGYHGLGIPPIGIPGASYVEQIGDGQGGYPFMSASLRGAGNTSNNATIDAGIVSIVAI